MGTSGGAGMMFEAVVLAGQGTQKMTCPSHFVVRFPPS